MAACGSSFAYEPINTSPRSVHILNDRLGFEMRKAEELSKLAKKTDKGRKKWQRKN